jgi:hypothetical protein
MSADTVIRHDDPVTPETALQMAVVPRNDHRLLPANAAEQAVWIRHDAQRIEPELAGSAHFGVVVGAFSQDQFCTGCVAVLYRIKRTWSHRQLSAAWARIPLNDLATWR